MLHLSLLLSPSIYRFLLRALCLSLSIAFSCVRSLSLSPSLCLLVLLSSTRAVLFPFLPRIYVSACVVLCTHVCVYACSEWFSVQRVALCPMEHFDVSARNHKEEVVGSVSDDDDEDVVGGGDDNTNSVATGHIFE